MLRRRRSNLFQLSALGPPSCCREAQPLPPKKSNNARECSMKTERIRMRRHNSDRSRKSPRTSNKRHSSKAPPRLWRQQVQQQLQQQLLQQQQQPLCTATCPRPSRRCAYPIRTARSRASLSLFSRCVDDCFQHAGTHALLHVFMCVSDLLLLVLRLLASAAAALC